MMQRRPTLRQSILPRTFGVLGARPNSKPINLNLNITTTNTYTISSFSPYVSVADQALASLILYVDTSKATRRDRPRAISTHGRRLDQRGVGLQSWA